MTELGDEFASRGYQQIIETYRDVHDNPSATEAAREGAKLLPKDRSLQLALAQQEADSGKADEAIARVRAMLDGKPADDREVWINIAQIESRLRHYGEAEKAVAHALELSQKPEEREFINFLAGSIYERQKKYDEAESYFRKVLADDARNAAALNYLGYMLVDHGTRLDEALAMIRKAVSLDPQNAAYLDSLGWAYFRLGRYEEAESELRKASERLESDPTVHQHLGDLYQKTNRLKLAVAEWERSLEEWKKSVPADQDAAEIAKTQKKLDGAKVKLAKHGEQPAQ
jgi:tetratricopeptide (TPR) repeat protein